MTLEQKQCTKPDSCEAHRSEREYVFSHLGLKLLRDHPLGASQIKGFRPLLEETFPSIYQIFRAYQNTNRWRIIDTMFVKSQPLDARVMFFR